MAPFDTYDLKKATEKRPGRIATAAEAADFLTGEFWRDGKGWIGELPKDAAIQTKIKDGLVTENVALEVIERHVGGVLGREPRWGMVERATRRLSRPRLAPRTEDEPTTENPQPRTNDLAALILEADDALTEWWDTRKVLPTLQAALARALAERRAPLRLYVPPGLRDDQSTVRRPTDLADALSMIYLEAPSPEAAGVYRDPDTQQDMGIYTFTRTEDAPNLPKGDYAELSYTNEEGRTVLRVVGGSQDQPVDVFAPLQLGGRLLVYDLMRKELLTPSVLQLQKALTLTLTQGQRNVNMAGSRERIITNAKLPGRWVAATATEPGAVRFPEDGSYRRFEPGPLPLGAGTTAFVQGEDVRNDAGEVIGMANPNVNYADPVPVTTFTETRAMWREAIHGQCHQLHALISGDATASGKSRVEARAEYEDSLELSKIAVDDALRWVLEAALYLAADLLGRGGVYAGLRVEAGCFVNTGPLSPEEQQQIRENYAAELTSEETSMVLIGHEDPAAEKQRIGKDRAERQARAPQIAPVVATNEQQAQGGTPDGG